MSLARPPDPADPCFFHALGALHGRRKARTLSGSGAEGGPLKSSDLCFFTGGSFHCVSSGVQGSGYSVLIDSAGS